jgi:hypothetical protein
MTTRGADYKRQPNDDYKTPALVTEDLLRFLKKDLSVRLCDPCPGAGAMLRVFKRLGYRIVKGPKDFITGHFPDTECDFVINPPYGGRTGKLAVAFVEHALALTQSWRGKAAVLLPFDFDAAKTRRHLFEHKAFAAKIVLPYRVPWFNNKAGSTIHAWYLFDHKHKGRPTIRYMPVQDA